MIRLFLVAIWNNRRRNTLVFVEMLMISLVLVNVVIYLSDLLSIKMIKNCYDAENVVLINITSKEREEKEIAIESFMNLKKTLESKSFVESVSLSTLAIPFNLSMLSSEFHYEENKFFLTVRQVDIDYARVLKITPIAGRWFDETDAGKPVTPVIVTKRIADRYFDGNAVGKRMLRGNDKIPCEIVGVTDEFKKNEMKRPDGNVFLFMDPASVNSNPTTSVLVRVKEGRASDLFGVAESQVYSIMNQAKWTISKLNSLENMRQAQNENSSQESYLKIIIAVFIIINVFLGTVGILWYNTNLRVKEIGIKRALGSTGFRIRRLLIAENMVLACIAMAIAIILMMQVPAIGITGKMEEGVFFKSIVISILIMIVLVMLSTWIPASIASKIHPAMALKTE